VTAACIVAGLLPLAIRSSGESGQVSWIAWPDPVQFLGFFAMVIVGMGCVRRPMNVRAPIQLPALQGSVKFRDCVEGWRSAGRGGQQSRHGGS
jgi:hypothetical protein